MKTTRTTSAPMALAACGLAILAPPAQAQSDGETVAPKIVIEDQIRTSPGFYNVPLDEREQMPAADTADALKRVPGVSVGRMGGHGLEPVIRGQSQSRINVISDGAYHQGGCPNRMDPPTAYSALGGFDNIAVLKGYGSVLTGPGATGGAVLLERDIRRFETDDLDIRGDSSLGFDDNGDNKFGEIDVSMGDGRHYVRYTGGFHDAGDYEDGAGNKVRSAFNEYNSGLTIGWTPTDKGGATLSYEFNRIDDALFAGAGMDSPESLSQTLRLKSERFYPSGAVEDFKFNLYATLIDHEMDNYSLRAPGSMYRRVDSDSDTIGGKATTRVKALGRTWNLALDTRFNDRKAVRLQGTNGGNVNATQAFLWPDIETTQIGLAGETTHDLRDDTRLVAGIRYDFVYASFGGRVDDRVEQAVNGQRFTPNELYKRFYGHGADDALENNFGGLLRLEHDLAPGQQVYGGLSRSVRTADATERGLANYNYMGGREQSWVGDPEIKPEAHHQVDIGYKIKRKRWNLDASAFANYVDDYILRDSARGQDGILPTATSSDVYRNIDAFLTGAEISGGYDIRRNLRLVGSTQYTLGQDLDRNAPLAQIPPLEGRLNLEYEDDRGFAVGTTMRAAMKQSRVDTNVDSGSGIDVRKTPGYAVFDIHASIRAFQPFELRFGVGNVLDKKYASHLNRSNSFDSEEIQVNEPGRSFYISAKAEF